MSRRKPDRLMLQYCPKTALFGVNCYLLPGKKISNTRQFKIITDTFNDYRIGKMALTELLLQSQIILPHRRTYKFNY